MRRFWRWWLITSRKTHLREGVTNGSSFCSQFSSFWGRISTWKQKFIRRRWSVSSIAFAAQHLKLLRPSLRYELKFVRNAIPITPDSRQWLIRLAAWKTSGENTGFPRKPRMTNAVNYWIISTMQFNTVNCRGQASILKRWCMPPFVRSNLYCVMD